MQFAPMVQATSVRTSLGLATAPGGLSPRAAEGEIHALAGPDSAGKNPARIPATLARTTGEPPSAGSARPGIWPRFAA
jgi:hypothetical protein